MMNLYENLFGNPGNNYFIEYVLYSFSLVYLAHLSRICSERLEYLLNQPAFILFILSCIFSSPTAGLQDNSCLSVHNRWR